MGELPTDKTPLPLLEPDRVRSTIDDRNVLVSDLRDALKDVMRSAAIVDVDKSEASTLTFVRVTQKMNHLADLMRLRAVAIRRASKR